MECSQKPACNMVDASVLNRLHVRSWDRAVYNKIKCRLDKIAKPIDGLGRFEHFLAQIGAIQGSEQIALSRKAVLIMCADNGIVAEGVSQSGQEVTAAVAKSMGKGASAVGRMAKAAGADTIPIDIGINCKEAIPGVLNRKVRRGTRNFLYEPAMTEEETLEAIFTGIRLVSDCKKKGFHLLATGEMGIGNTTTSSAVTAALLECEVKEVTGRGAGLKGGLLFKKQELIEQALEKYKLRGADAFTILKTVGGLDIAGLAGVCIGGAINQLPIVLDGVISMTAALLAERLVPGVAEYLIPSHKGKEPAADRLGKALGLMPVIDANMALGEGTGAVMFFSLLDLAFCVYENGTTFPDIRVEPYERYESIC